MSPHAVDVLPNQTVDLDAPLPTIGNQEHAEFVARHLRATPWEKVGSGAYRIVFLAPDESAVYKICTSSPNMQVQEVERIHRAWRSHPCYRSHIPAASLFTVNGFKVVAMEYGPKPLHAVPTPVYDAAREMGLTDIKGPNCRVRDNGDIMLVDWGEPW